MGDEVTLRLGDGARVRTRVGALLDSPSSYPSVVVPSALLAAHTTGGLPTHVLPVTGLAARLAIRGRPIDAIVQPGQ